MVAAALGQFVLGLAMDAEGPLEISYRQAVTPDRLLARMSATMRSVNRGMIVVGALLGGAIATAWNVAAALWIERNGVLGRIDQVGQGRGCPGLAGFRW